MVGLVGFELAARVALEVAPVRLGRFRPRLASAQPPDLGGEQLAQAVEYPSEFGADGGQQAVAAPDLTVGLAPLADASGPFDGPGGVSLVDGGFEVAALVFEAPVVDSRGLVQPRVAGVRPGLAQGLVYEALSEEWRKRDGEISDPWANDEADGYQPPSYEPVNPERRTAQTPSDGLI